MKFIPLSSQFFFPTQRWIRKTCFADRNLSRPLTTASCRFGKIGCPLRWRSWSFRKVDKLHFFGMGFWTPVKIIQYITTDISIYSKCIFVWCLYWWCVRKMWNMSDFKVTHVTHFQVKDDLPKIEHANDPFKKWIIWNVYQQLNFGCSKLNSWSLNL